jgi:hypothetical protein
MIQESFPGKKVFIPNWTGEGQLAKNLDIIMDMKFLANPYFIQAQVGEMNELPIKHYVDEANRRNCPLIVGLPPGLFDIAAKEAAREHGKYYAAYADQVKKLMFLFTCLSKDSKLENIWETLNSIETSKTR